MPPIDNNQNPENSTGPVIAIIIVLAVIILGGLYFWGERTNMNSYDTSLTTEESMDSITTQSSSDDLDSIESDLNETNIEDIGSDL